MDRSKTNRWVVSCVEGGQGLQGGKDGGWEGKDNDISQLPSQSGMNWGGDP